MSERLDIILSLIDDSGTGVIDVGTDHAIVPIALAKRGYTGNIIASDLNSIPLSKAKKYAEENGVLQRIEFRESDGLSLCQPDEIDTIVIAGLGGDTVCDILDAAEWTMDPSYLIITQVMTRPEVLRFWLTNNGYSILEEIPVTDMQRPYSIIKVQFTGSNTYYSDAEYYVGKNPSRDMILKSLKQLEKRPKHPFFDSIIQELRSKL